MFPDPILARTLSPPPLGLLDPDAQGCAHLLVEHEQMLGAFTFRGEPRAAIELVDSAVDRLVRAAEVRRHQIRVVKVGQRRIGMSSASVEDGLCQGIELGQVRMSGWHRKRVVNDTDGIHVPTLKPSRHGPHPGHVHGRGEQREISEGCIGKKPELVARDSWRLQPANGQVLPPFRTDFRENEKQCGGQDVYLPQRGRISQFQRGRPLAGSPVRANGGDPRSNARQPGQRGRGRIMQGENPALATL